LRSGHVDEGLPLLKRVLEQVGLRLAMTPRRALLSYLVRRVQLRLRGLSFRERPATEIPAKDLIRIDTCWSASSALSFLDTVVGRDFQMRHMLLALKAGEPYRVARAMGNEAGYSGLPGWPAHKRTERIVATAMGLAKRVNHPHALAMAHIGAGIAAYLEGRWKEGWDLAQLGEQILRERCTGVAFELNMIHVYSLRALVFLGGLRELSERLPKLLKDAAERADIYAETSLKTRHAYMFRLMFDQPEKARSELGIAAAKLSHRGYHVQHYFHLVSDTEISLYAGMGASAFQKLPESWRALKGALLVQGVQFFRIEWLHLRGRCAVAAACGEALSVSHREELLRSAQKDARRIERERVRWGDPLGALLRAGISSLRGEREESLQSLASAETGFAAADMALYAAAARRCRGVMLGGDEGRALVDAADAWMRNERIRNPERMAAMLAPGSWALTAS
jgi:eukaryotic-like serine/threonine-protein kinase